MRRTGGGDNEENSFITETTHTEARKKEFIIEDSYGHRPISGNEVACHPQYSLPEGELNINIQEYGNRIKKRREELNLTMKALADGVGCAYQTIQQIEKGERAGVNPDLVPKLAAKLNCTSHYLIGLSQFPNGIYDPEYGDRELPIMIAMDGEFITIKELQDGYRRDPDLARICVKLLNGSHEQRKYYKKKLELILKHAKKETRQSDE